MILNDDMYYKKEVRRCKKLYESIRLEDNLYVKVLHFDTETQSIIYPVIDNQVVKFILFHWYRSIEFSYVKKGKVNVRTSSELAQISAANYLLLIPMNFMKLVAFQINIVK